MDMTDDLEYTVVGGIDPGNIVPEDQNVYMVHICYHTGPFVGDARNVKELLYSLNRYESFSLAVGQTRIVLVMP